MIQDVVLSAAAAGTWRQKTAQTKNWWLMWNSLLKTFQSWANGKKTCLCRHWKKKSLQKIHTKARKRERKQLAVLWYTAKVIAATATKCDSTKSENLSADSPHNKRKTHTSHRRPVLFWRGGKVRGSNVGHMWKLMTKKRLSRLPAVAHIFLTTRPRLHGRIIRTGGFFLVATCGAEINSPCDPKKTYFACETIVKTPLTWNMFQGKSLYCIFLSHGLKLFSVHADR